MPKKRKKVAPEIDVFDLNLYSVDENISDPQASGLSDSSEVFLSENSQSSPEHTEPRHGARQAIDQLILQDIAEHNHLHIVQSKPHKAKKKALEARQTKKRNSSVARASHKSIVRGQHEQPSAHVLDLRKHYLIEKNSLDKLEMPKHGLGYSIVAKLRSTVQPQERTEWHIPSAAGKAPRKQEPEEMPFGEPEESVTHMQQYSWRGVLVFCAILLILLLPFPGISLLENVTNLKDSFFSRGVFALNELKAGVDEINKSSFAQAQEHLSSAGKNFTSIQSDLNAYTAAVRDVINILPGVGGKLRLATALTDLGERASRIGVLLSHTAESSGTAVSPSDVVASLRQDFEGIADSLSSVRGDILALRPEDAPEGMADKVAFVQSNIDSIIDDANRAAKMLDVAYYLTGGETYSRYLFLFQNNRELRPTGGFIGSFALVDFARGMVKDISFPGGGTYDVTAGFKHKLLPPKPLTIINPEWYMWDGNWWPDFPTSARKLAWFYQESGGPTVDGIVAINSDVVVEILKLTGPIEMPAYKSVITADNFYDVIQKEVELDYDAEVNKPKQILKDLMPILIERLVAQGDYLALLKLFTGSLSRKDIQVYAVQEEQQRKIQDLGWSGSLASTPKDYLMVVSTNIAGGKSDASIYETIDHVANVAEDGKITVTTTITKEHRGNPEDMFSYVNNVDYIRAYVPYGSQLVDAQGFMPPRDDQFRTPSELQVEDEDYQRITGSVQVDQKTGVSINHELNRTVFGHWMQVEPGSRASVSFTYVLPFRLHPQSPSGISWLINWSGNSREVDGYGLYVQKQSGRRNVILNTTLNLPESYYILWGDGVTSDKLGLGENTASYSASLDSDTDYAVLVGKRAK